MNKFRITLLASFLLIMFSGSTQAFIATNNVATWDLAESFHACDTECPSDDDQAEFCHHYAIDNGCFNGTPIGCRSLPNNQCKSGFASVIYCAVQCAN